MNKENVLLAIHYILFIFNLLAPVLLPIRYIKKFLVYFLTIIVHWYFLKGQCIITYLGKNKDHGNDLDGIILTKKGWIFDLLVYSIIVVCSF